MTAVASLTRVRDVIDHTMPIPPHNKVKYLALICWLVSLPNQDFIFCQKHLGQAFFYVIFFHSHLFNEMFIVNGKSHCCKNTFTTNVRFTSLLAAKCRCRSWRTDGRDTRTSVVLRVPASSGEAWRHITSVDTRWDFQSASTCIHNHVDKPTSQHCLCLPHA